MRVFVLLAIHRMNLRLPNDREMIRLVQTFGAHAGRTREFDQNVITFGRLPTNDVAFDPHADLDASGAHAEIRREGDAWVLVDSHSRNGTLIHGRVIQKHTLSHGDEIEFGTGGPRMRFENVAPAAPAPAPPPPQRGVHTMPATPIEAEPVPKLYGQQTFDAAVEAAAARSMAGTASPAVWPVQAPPRAPTAYGAAPVPAPLPTPAYMANPAPPPVVAPSSGPNTTSVWLIVGSLAGLGCLALFCMVAAAAVFWMAAQ